MAKMSETDGQIRIKVNLDTQEIDKDIQKLQEKLEKQNESLNRLDTKFYTKKPKKQLCLQLNLKKFCKKSGKLRKNTKI